jgi:3-oxoacyl-[acyl-carrier protein] reductase
VLAAISRLRDSITRIVTPANVAGQLSLVNAVAPGRINTPRVRASHTDAEWAAAAQRIPLGHAGEPEDVAEAIAYLASDAAKHMTGQTIHVNGGRIMT